MGGFFSQNLMPWVGQATHNPGAPMLVPAVCLAVLCVGAVVAIGVAGKVPPGAQPA